MINATHGLMTFKQSLLADSLPFVYSAFSLSRRIKGTYAGSAFRVRRASDNSEMDIGFINNVIDIATLNSFLTATTGFVTTIYDQVNTKHLVNTTSAAQPALIVSGSLVAARFTGSHTLIASGTAALVNPETIGLNSFSANCSGNSAASIVSSGIYVAGQIRGNYILTNRYYSIAGGGTSNIDTTISETVKNSFTSIFNRHTPGSNLGSIQGYVNGTLQANAGSVTMGGYNQTGLTIGASIPGTGDFLNGDILEVFKADGLWTASEAATLNSSQNSFYSSY